MPKPTCWMSAVFADARQRICDVLSWGWILFTQSLSRMTADSLDVELTTPGIRLAHESPVTRLSIRPTVRRTATRCRSVRSGGVVVSYRLVQLADALLELRAEWSVAAGVGDGAPLWRRDQGHDVDEIGCGSWGCGWVGVESPVCQHPWHEPPDGNVWPDEALLAEHADVLGDHVNVVADISHAVSVFDDEHDATEMVVAKPCLSVSLFIGHGLIVSWRSCPPQCGIDNTHKNATRTTSVVVDLSQARPGSPSFTPRIVLARPNRCEFHSERFAGLTRQ